ncbi:MAG TPA: glycosyltransferase, partial [Sulfurihydrogenibium sp.]|nr:glycosyltransferase [Sulfurihydrogenibium sp.]
MSKDKIYVSIVVPIYNEEENLPILYEKIKTVMEELKKQWNDKDYEIILVNDGSSDKSWEIIKNLAE